MVMKTFTAGERLFASDLNDNFDETQLAGNITSGTLDAARVPNLDASKITTGTISADRLPALGPEFSTAASNAVAIVFDRDRVITRAATGTVTFSGSSYTAGKSATVRIVPGGTQRTLTFPAGWKFVSFKPANVAANKTAVLTVTSFGTVEADCVAAYAVQA
jgi:hypothetical protein